MTLIIEDGTVVPNANSWVTDADAQAYFAARPTALTAWLTKTAQADREGDLVTAADYMNSGLRWRSNLVSIAQTMAFPRWAWGSAIPWRIKQAQIILALASRTTTFGQLVPDRSVKSLTQKLEGVGEETTTYDDAPQEVFLYASTLEGLLAPYLGGATSSFEQARVTLG